MFAIGQEIDLRPFAANDRHARFGVLAISADGIMAIAPDGGVGFLPWEMLSVGVSNPGLVEITPFDEELDSPGATLIPSVTSNNGKGRITPWRNLTLDE